MTTQKTIREILSDGQQFIGQKVQLNGWVRTSRDVKACVFVELNDGSTVKNMQVVANVSGDCYNMAAGLRVGSAVIVNGIIEASPNPQQPVELNAQSIVLEGGLPVRLSLAEKTAFFGIPAHHPASEAKNKYFQRGFSHPQRGGVRPA